MAPTLLNQLKSFVSSSLVSKLSKIHEENEVLIRKSIETGISAVLIGLYNKIDDTCLYETLLESIEKSEFYKAIDFENIKSLQLNNSFDLEGIHPLSLIFPYKKERISEMISNEISVKSDTACAILNLSVLFVLSYLKKQMQNLNELSQILEKQKSELLNEVPVGIKVILGFSGFECDLGNNYSVYNEDQPSFASTIYNFFLNRKYS